MDPPGRGTTRNKNIIIAGGSAGGMLIGNVINTHPNLFKGAIALIPFVDVLNTMLDESMPLTPGEWEEWGNPQSQPMAPYGEWTSKQRPLRFYSLL